MLETKRRGSIWLIVVCLIVALIVGMAPMMGGSAYEANAAAKVKAPSNFKVKVNKKKRTVKLSWKKPAKKAKVQVYVKAGKKKYKRVATTKKKTYTIKKLKYNVKYNIKVRTKKGKKYSKFKKYKKTIIFKKPKKKTTNKKTEKNTDQTKNDQTKTDQKKPDQKKNEQPKQDKTDQPKQDNPKVDPKTDDPKTDDPKEEQQVSIINEKATKIIDQGWIQFVAVSFEDGYNKENCSIIVDGVDVTEAATNVTDDGSIVKWEITSLKPAKLTVKSKKNSKDSEEVTLSDNTAPVKPVVKKRQHADYVMGHAPVSIFDYYLTNYDDQGNVRVMPAKTTFSKSASGSKDRIRSYSEDAELKTDGTGEVVVMFNYKSDADKSWFDNVAEEGAVELVAYDEQKNTINSRLTYTKDTAYPHGAGTVAAIKIPLGQDNFRTNGRYYIRTKSQGGKAALTAINVVNEVAPTMLVKENGAIKSGQNIHFQIENMVEGLKESIEEVVLTTPSGKTETLIFIDDWYHFGNTGLFVLYNDPERNDGEGVNHTKENGVYTVTVKAAGFKTFSKKFEVTGGSAANTANVAKSAKTAKSTRMKVDAVSSATGVSGDSGSGGSGGSKVSADLLFDVDLLANAIIMDELGMDNANATAIAERWQTEMIPDYIFTEDGVSFYTWTEYVNAVSDAKLDDGFYLSFADYAKRADAKTTDNRPSRVKAVLEDNMLGDITDKYLGVKTPELTLDGEFVSEGEDAVFSCDNPEYLNAIKSILPSDDTRALDPSMYEVTGDKLIIKAAALRLGNDITKDNTFDIRATGFKEMSVVVPYKKNLEEFSLKLEKDSYEVGQDVKVILDGSKGDFLKNLTGVKLGDKQVLNASQGGTSGNKYYEINEDKTEIVLKEGNFSAEGTYTLTLSATYYGDKTIDITMSKKQDEPEALAAPAVSGIVSEGGMVKVTFEGEEADVEKYLKDIRSISVGGNQYAKATLGLVGFFGAVNESQYDTAQVDPNYGGRYVVLRMAVKGGFSEEADTEVEIVTNEYQTLTFTVSKDVFNTGSGGGDNPDDPDDPDNPDDPQEGIQPPAAKSFETISSSSWYSSYKYHYIAFEGSEEDLGAYIKAITSVEVGEAAYSKLSDYEYLSEATGNGYKEYTGSYGRDHFLGITAGEGFSEDGDTVITIKAEGYKPLTITVDKDGKIKK